MRSFLLVVLILSGAIVCGCESNAIKLSKQDEQFALVYAEMLLIHADYERVHGNGGAFSKLDSLQNVFSDHALSAQSFQEQYVRYMNEPERWNKVQERALSILTKLREQALNLQTKPEAQGENGSN